jgi:hypothetical protein
MKLLSVIVPKDERLQEICKSELKGLDYEVISTSNWKDGLKHATGEYVAFIEAGSDISEGYFWDNLRIFTSQPSFRKLAVVGSAISDGEHQSPLFGYLLSTQGSKVEALPSHLQSSSNPYAAQIVYLPGAVIRRSVLAGFTFSKDLLVDSVRLSLQLWATGSRVYLNPNTTYFDGSERRIMFPFEYRATLPPTIIQVTTMFKREMVG